MRKHAAHTRGLCASERAIVTRGELILVEQLLDRHCGLALVSNLVARRRLVLIAVTALRASYADAHLVRLRLHLCVRLERLRVDHLVVDNLVELRDGFADEVELGRRVRRRPDATWRAARQRRVSTRRGGRRRTARRATRLAARRRRRRGRGDG